MRVKSVHTFLLVAGPRFLPKSFTHSLWCFEMKRSHLIPSMRVGAAHNAKELTHDEQVRGRERRSDDVLRLAHVLSFADHRRRMDRQRAGAQSLVDVDLHVVTRRHRRPVDEPLHSWLRVSVKLNGERCAVSVVDNLIVERQRELRRLL